MFILFAFIVTASGTVSTAVAEFHSQDSCEVAKQAVFQTIPTPNKTLVCVAK